MKNFITIVLLLLILYLLWDNNKRETFQGQQEENINTYIINLDQSQDRLELITNQCKREGLNCHRFSAVNGKKLDVKTMDIVENKKIDKGALGCSLSHINLWKKVEKKGDDMFIVLEDDCIIETDFNKKLADILKEAPKDWDIIYLGGSNLKGKNVRNNLIEPIKVNSKSTHNTGTYGMLIRRKCLRVLIEDNLPIRDKIDQNLKNNMYDKLGVYFAVPPLVKHNNELASMRRLNSGKSATTRWFSEVQDKIEIV